MKILFCLCSTILFFSYLSAQVGINTETPQKSLHVNGSMQITNELSLGGDASTPGNPGTTGQVLVSNGSDTAPTWQTLLNQSFSDLATGTVIAIDGKLIIAQEITVLMSKDFSAPAVSSGDGIVIGNLDNVIIDNDNNYVGSATSNSFQVNEDGVYSINMNMQIQTTNATKPVVGIWNNNTDNWVARVNDTFAPATNGFQTYSLLTSIPMYQGTVYSFRVVNTTTTRIKAFSEGFTGDGPVSQVSVKRLK